MSKPVTWAEMVADPRAGQARILANQVAAKNNEIFALRGEVCKLRDVLADAKEKLAIYRSLHNGEYAGGMEYTALMAKIDEALNV